MGLFDNLVQREAGQPQAPAVSGAPAQASSPASFVNPPAAASAPVGRPPVSFPGGAGPSLPLQAPRPPAAPASPTGAPSRPQPAPGGGQAPKPSSQGTAPVPQAASPFMVQMDRVPSRGELSQLPPGVQVQTPYGSVGADGQIQFTPEGQMRYQQAHQARVQEFGPHLFAGDPNAPKPPVTLGKASINPFTGKWLR